MSGLGRLLTGAGVLALLLPVVAGAPASTDERARRAAYPLDGWEYTGIRRLRGYQLMLDGSIGGGFRLPAGALLPSSAMTLRLAHLDSDLDVDTKNPTLQAGLERIFAGRNPSYRVALLDITDPANPRYAAMREHEGYYPGSVGKLLVATAVFDQLARLYPDDVEARARILRETMISADEFAMPNSHAVPIVADDYSSVTHRSVRIGDTFSLWEWLDHALSPSSNAAGSMAWKHALLMEEFGHDYPPTPEQEQEFLRSTPPAELAARSIRLIEQPLVVAGLDTARLYLKGHFTRGGQRRIPPQASRTSPRELVRWLMRLEQGRVVDEWSSLEMKKLMYFTRRRYRYAASSALAGSAVFFKSGSLYRCREEEGYECVQYAGNVENLMHSVAIVESPAEAPERVYLVSMMSNNLKVDSAREHMEIAAQIERLMGGPR